MVSQLRSSATTQENLATSLEQAADDIDTGTANAEADHQKIKELAQSSAESVDDLVAEYNADIKPMLEELATETSSLVNSIESNMASLDSTDNALEDTANTLSTQVDKTRGVLNGAASELATTGDKISDMGTAIKAALATGDSAVLRQVLESDPDSLAAALANPIQLERTAVFPADNFGSQMAPLYATLALWIGSLLLCVAIKVTVSDDMLKELDHPKQRHIFLGRFGILALISLMQTTVMAIGNMFFLGVQANNPWLYMICFWTAGLVFTFIIYTLVVSFANLGKAIGVVLLIIQVTSAGGSFPLQLLPEFFQVLSPYVPATHVINAMRAAMMGVYMNDFWIEIFLLLLFVVPMLLLGLVLRKPLIKFLNWYLEQVDASKLVS